MILKFRENRVRRAYFGGKRIDCFKGKESPADGRYPEEWIASTATAFNPDMPKENEGLSVLEDGTFFRDLLRKEPEGFWVSAFVKSTARSSQFWLSFWTRRKGL